VLGSLGESVWFHIARLIFTFLLTAVFGVQAFAMYKSNVVAARKWVYFLYSIAFLFASTANFVYLMVALQMEDYSKSRFSLGLLSMVLIFSYFALTYGVSKRSSRWNENGQEPAV
jgi:hypothetical protein